jgi:hypothetical protein
MEGEFCLIELNKTKGQSRKNSFEIRLIIDAFALFKLALFSAPVQPRIRKHLCLGDRLFPHLGHIA